MKCSCYQLAGASLAFVLAFVPDVRADLIPWAYNWSRSPAQIHADAPGTGYITLSDESLHTTVGDSDIVATNLKTVSTATAAHPDIYTAKAYSVVLSLTDLASGKSGNLTFTGVISGQVTASSSNLQNTFTGPVSQQLILGGNVYTTTIGPFTPPGPPDSNNAGSIGGHESVSVKVTSIETLPEPGTLALSLLGLGALGAGRRWGAARKRGAEK